MKQQRWLQIKDILAQVLESAPADRAAVLDTLCRQDQSIRREIEIYLSLETEVDQFLAEPLVERNSPQEQPMAKISALATPIHSNISSNNLIGQLIDGKYRVEQQLGQGGMGAVYLATHLGTKRSVALKVISSQMMNDREFVERFKREAEAAGRLRHPNVVNVTDFGFTTIAEQNLAYLVMEYLRGYTLSTLLQRQPQLPLTLIADITEQICLAIDEAHKQGIIHRDLKPDNIWLEPNGRGGYNVKVLDFGLVKINSLSSQDLNTSIVRDEAKSELPTLQLVDKSPQSSIIKKPGNSSQQDDSTLKLIDDNEPQTLLIPQEITKENRAIQLTVRHNLTNVGAIMGTPSYMSPEQCSGSTIDNRSDIYSLGVIVYQMLAGETPFKGNLHQLLDGHINQAPSPLKSKRRNIPKGLVKLVMSALEKDPAKRPVSAMAFATTLKANIEGEQPILRKAMELYRQHFLAFVVTSLRAHLLFILLYTLLDHLVSIGLLWKVEKLIPLKVAYWFYLPLLLFSNNICAAAFANITKTLISDPQSQIKIKQPFQNIYRKFGVLLVTSILSFVYSILGLFKLNINGFVNNLFHPQIVILEDERGHLALLRSQHLASNLHSVLAIIQLRNYLVSLFTIILLPICSSLCLIILDSGIHFEYELLVVPITLSIPCLFLILVSPIVTTCNNLLYFQARQSVGEEVVIEASNDLDPAQLNERSVYRYWRSIILVSILTMTIFGWIIFKDQLLRLAVQNRMSRTTRLLIKLGANVNAKEESLKSLSNFKVSYSTPLMIATENDDYNLVNDLLYYGADINARDQYGNSALSYAIMRGSYFLVMNLVNQGADVHATMWDGNTTLMQAASMGNSAVVRLLVTKGVDVNAKTMKGKSALMCACSNADIARYLLSKGANPNVRNDKGETPLMYKYAFNDDPETIRVMVDGGVDINAQDYDGRTALMHVIFSSHAQIKRFFPETIKELIAQGSDLSIKDRYGRTALMYAQELGYQNYIEILKTAGAKE